jgi:hypothetical protein
MSTVTSHRSPSGTQRFADLGLGLLGGVMVVLALAVVLFGDWTATDGASAPLDDVPTLQLRAAVPLEGARGLVLRFRSERPLRLTRDGWGVGPLHVHASVDGIEYMPAARDIREVSPGEYEWTLPGVGAGSAEVRLFWSDESHRPMEAGASDVLTVPIR